MSVFYRWDMLHPLTRRDIGMMPRSTHGRRVDEVRTCGCCRARRWDGTADDDEWFVCEGHRRYDDGAVAMQEHLTEARTLLADCLAFLDGPGPSRDLRDGLRHRINVYLGAGP